MEILYIRKYALLTGIHALLNDFIQKRAAKDKAFEEDLSEQFHKIRNSNQERFELLIPTNSEQQRVDHV